MSLLWKGIQKIKSKKKLLTSHKRPSPRNKLCFFNPAQGLFPYVINLCNTIKGIPPSIFSVHRLSAGMTVEASIVLPLFIFFFLNLSSAIEMIRLHGNLELALWNIGNQMSAYGCMLSNGEEISKSSDWWDQAAGVAFSYFYVKETIGSFLGKQYLEESPVYNGIDGLQFWESDIFTEGDEFEIIVTYKVSPYSDMVSFFPFRMMNRYYGHIWSGYELPMEDSENVTWVYITEHGKVYHKNSNCSHIKLSIQETTLQNALGSFNSNGGRYQTCILCGSGSDGKLKQYGNINVVWITSDGNAIHYSRDCSGLKRTVSKVRLDEVAGYLPCSRCGR